MVFDVGIIGIPAAVSRPYGELKTFPEINEIMGFFLFGNRCSRSFVNQVFMFKLNLHIRSIKKSVPGAKPAVNKVMKVKRAQFPFTFDRKQYTAHVSMFTPGKTPMIRVWIEGPVKTEPPGRKKMRIPVPEFYIYYKQKPGELYWFDLTDGRKWQWRKKLPISFWVSPEIVVQYFTLIISMDWAGIVIVSDPLKKNMDIIIQSLGFKAGETLEAFINEKTKRNYIRQDHTGQSYFIQRSKFRA
jgi:hypothetical protein